MAGDGKESNVKLNTNPDIALMILDVMMPKYEWSRSCQAVRKDSRIPILMLSAKSGDMDKIQGLITGADDYVTKPFNPLEVMGALGHSCVVQKMLYRPTPDVLDIGSLVIIKDSHEVKTSDGDLVNLTALEFGIFVLISFSSNRVFSADDIFERVWHKNRLYQQKQLWELRQISADNADMAIDWHATYAPKTQALIDVSNTIATNTRRIREEERASERSKDEMITNISHDLRTPLTAIIGYLGLVEMGENLSDDNRKKYIHTAYDKSNQMKVLVEDLFEFSKTQAQDASLNLTSLSLSDLFGQLLASYEL
ncbi:hypothetical protein Pfo_031346 [Paulownia fortunei]|nr:hypothetical protein Pfo_031346 [Paulownia fortunei]